MNQTVDAVYEDGVFRLLGPMSEPIVEGQRVRLVVDTASASPDEILEAAAQVYAGLSEEEIRAVEELILDRQPWFPDRTGE